MKAPYWDKPWNPIVGCRPISPACDNCYAKAQTERFKCSFVPHLTNKISPPTSGVVFCGNMTDLFGEWVTARSAAKYIEQTIGHQRTATYLWLTKRPGTLARALRVGVCAYDDDCRGMRKGMPFRCCDFDNQYFGFTAENQEWFDKRFVTWYEHVPLWANAWVSAEPLLGPINLHLERFMFRWVVVGSESGPRRRPCNLDWVFDIVGQCARAGVPVYVKQLEIDGKCERDISKFPKELQRREVPWEVKD